MSISSQEGHGGRSGNGHHIIKQVVLPADIIRYGECLKNHAAAMGGNARDGCGEFMPGGEEGTLEALKCSACNCHRNFHKKLEGGGECNSQCYRTGAGAGAGISTVTPVPEVLLQGYPTMGNQLMKSISAAPSQMVMSYGMGIGRSLTDDHEHQLEAAKKRHRTKFTKEQKEKMQRFAEESEWKIQKLEEPVVQQFCQEIGIKRRVLKVWMHNNKNNNLLAKKNNLSAASL